MCVAARVVAYVGWGRDVVLGCVYVWWGSCVAVLFGGDVRSLDIFWRVLTFSGA